MKSIAKVTPLLFNDALIIGLSKKWLDVFPQVPTFEVKIDKQGRLIIQSQEKVRSNEK